MIECEKESSHRQAMGDLGVKVQTGRMTSDPITNIMTREVFMKVLSNPEMEVLLARMVKGVTI